MAHQHQHRHQQAPCLFTKEVCVPFNSGLSHLPSAGDAPSGREVEGSSGLHRNQRTLDSLPQSPRL